MGEDECGNTVEVGIINLIKHKCWRGSVFK